MTNMNDIIEEAVAAAQAVEQQGATTGQKVEGDAKTKLAASFKAAAPLLKGLEVLKKKSPRTGFLRRHAFNFKVREKTDHVCVSTNIQFYKREKSSLSVNVNSGGEMTVLFNDPGSCKRTATTTSEIINVVARGAMKTGLIK